MSLAPVLLCDAVRTPFGRYGGALAPVRTDDLASVPLAALQARHPQVDWAALDDVVLGCANQSGEDNRNVARMALLLAGLPVSVPGVTINRLCGSSLDAIASAARQIACGDADLLIAGGVEGMSRSPYVIAKADTALTADVAFIPLATPLRWSLVAPGLDEWQANPRAWHPLTELRSPTK